MDKNGIIFLAPPTKPGGARRELKLSNRVIADLILDDDLHDIDLGIILTYVWKGLSEIDTGEDHESTAAQRRAALEWLLDLENVTPSNTTTSACRNLCTLLSEVCTDIDLEEGRLKEDGYALASAPRLRERLAEADRRSEAIGDDLRGAVALIKSALAVTTQKTKAQGADA